MKKLRNMKNHKEELKKLKRIVEETWKDTYGVTGEDVVKLTDKIDIIFYESGYIISYDKIAHFVVECIKKK